jgi:hypothetical protein
MFKFQAVLARNQPFLLRSVEKRGDQSRFKCSKKVNYFAIRSMSGNVCMCACICERAFESLTQLGVHGREVLEYRTEMVDRVLHIGRTHRLANLPRHRSIAGHQSQHSYGWLDAAQSQYRSHTHQNKKRERKMLRIDDPSRSGLTHGMHRPLRRSDIDTANPGRRRQNRADRAATRAVRRHSILLERELLLAFSLGSASTEEEPRDCRSRVSLLEVRLDHHAAAERRLQRGVVLLWIVRVQSVCHVGRDQERSLHRTHVRLMRERS